MNSRHDQFLHEIDAEEVFTILKDGFWQVYNHVINSADTNTNDCRAANDMLESVENTSGIDAYRDIAFEPHVSRILDVGGGRFDCNLNYLLNEKNIHLLIWDPFNRAEEHNNTVKLEVQREKVAAAVSMSVLNVVPDIQSRLAHIATLFAALSDGGKAYFKIWPGEDLFRGTYLPTETLSSYQANAFADRFYREIEVVFGNENVRFDKRISNLIVATKSSRQLLCVEAIKVVQAKVRNETPLLFKLKQCSLVKINFFQNPLMQNLRFFKMVERRFLEENRHQDVCLQKAYDQRFGIIVRYP